MSIFVIFDRLRSKSVSFFPTWIEAEIFPRYELFPVRTTTPVPVPKLTVEPPRHMLFNSAALTSLESAPTNFYTGIQPGRLTILNIYFAVIDYC